MRGSGLGAVALFGVFASGSTLAEPPGGWRAGAEGVRVWGDLRGVMHRGEIGAKVSLSSLVPGPHTYAVGALEDLRGEITIVDDQIWTARTSPTPAGAAPRIEHAARSDEKATLLVAARMDTRVTVTLKDDVPFEQLGDRIEQLLKQKAFDLDRAHLIVVEGTFRDVGWHILSGAVRDHAGQVDHDKSRMTGSSPTMRGRVIGFFSRHHQGVFTHAGQRLHLHIVAADPAFTAHVDTMGIARGSTITFASAQRASSKSATRKE